MPDLDTLDRRQSRVEDAIERLTDISSNLNKMIAVHDQRLTQQEKDSDILHDTVEKRREEFEKEITSNIKHSLQNILHTI